MWWALAFFGVQSSTFGPFAFELRDFLWSHWMFVFHSAYDSCEKMWLFFSKNFVILLTTFYAINDDDSGNIWQQQLLTHRQPKFNRLWYWFHMFMYFKLFLEAVNFIQLLAKAKQAYSLTCCQEYRNSLSSFSSTRVKIQTFKKNCDL